ncbi:Serine/threonine protein kinase [Parasponia andersonii]|uniref:non-specific serine/threonine protein kinase n=1 Tax=Parasponia andersonii TaxID=3476 RepID=A0A2P5D7S5_PARAD|nr:Serine/threonine protein kinase [Parasponia andersonii]
MVTNGNSFAGFIEPANSAVFTNATDGQILIYYQLPRSDYPGHSSGLVYTTDTAMAVHVVNIGTSKKSYPHEFIECVKLDSDGHLRRYRVINWRNEHTFIKILRVIGEPSSLPPTPSSSPSPLKALPPALPSRHSKDRLAKIISASTAGGLVMIILIILVSLVMFQKNRSENDGEDDLNQVPGVRLRFTLEELEVATEDFKEMLGSVGFGSVFKGVLPDGTRIALKRLEKMSPWTREFLAEVETIGKLHHFNLVTLVGFCAEKSSRLLVYEYMSHGSLDNWIFSRNTESSYLDWKTRKKVILDIAKGLAYLHEDCRQKVIHLDIKPHNILFDENFNAKVSDFGLSKLIERDESQVLIPMRGTPGYLAPDVQQAIVTVKADVYSFGIVILEIVSKRRNVDGSRSESRFHLLKLLQKKAEEDQLIDIVEDLDEEIQKSAEEVVKMIKIGAWCLQNDHTKWKELWK